MKRLARGKRVWIGAGLALCLLCAASRLWTNRMTLTIGIFSGSNWDVTDEDCYQAYNTAIVQFERDHPGVRVEYVSGIPREDYSEWLAEQIVMGCEPDVYLVPEEDLLTLAGLGALMQLDRMLDADPNTDAQAFYPAALAAGQVNEHTYALPYQCVPTMMFVNCTLLETYGIAQPQDGWTWNDFYQICQAVTEAAARAGDDAVYGCVNYSWAHAAAANGVAVFDKQGRSCAFDDPRVQRAVTFYDEITQLSAHQPVPHNAFREGRAAFSPMLLSNYRAERSSFWKIRQDAGFKCSGIAMPAGPHGDNAAQMSTLLMGVSARTHAPDLAWQLLNTMTADDDFQRMLCQDSAGLSGLRSVVQAYTAEQTQIETQPNARMTMQRVDGVMERAVVRPVFPGYDTVMQFADSEIAAMLDAEKDLGNGLLGLQRNMLSMLED